MIRRLAYVICVGVGLLALPGCGAALGGNCFCGASDPSWSPDGKTIVYSHNDDGEDNHIYAVRSGGGAPRRLTVHADDFSPVWAPDGSKIAFTRSSPSSLMVIDPDGSNERRVATNPGDGAPRWSPDGIELAFGNGQALRVVRVEDGSKVSGTRVSRRPVVPDAFDWAPDGRLAFISNGQIYVASVGGRPKRLTKRGTRAQDWLDWSPDGRKIAFVSAHRMLVMNSDGSGIRRLSGSHSPSYQPSWSPSGKLIAWLEDGTIMVANSDASGRRKLPYRKSGYNLDQYTFAWSPDSKSIVFSGVPVDAESDGETELFIIKLAHPKRVTPLT
jgi:Tol biopolymer transport system component